MTGKCPASGTVVPKELRGGDLRVRLARCPVCGRGIGVATSARSNYEPTYRPHVMEPAPSTYTHYASGAPR